MNFADYRLIQMTGNDQPPPPPPPETPPAPVEDKPDPEN